MASLVNTTVTSAAGSGVALAVTGGNDLVDNILLNLLNHSGSTVLNVRNNGALYGTDGTFSGSIYINDTNTRIHEGTTNSVRIQTNSGYLDLGPMNTSYAHLQTDRGRFYFNRELVVDSGIIRSYNEDLQFDASYSGAVAKNIIFRTGNVEKVRMNTDGNVGIGTTNPGARLDLHAGNMLIGDSYLDHHSTNDNYGLQIKSIDATQVALELRSNGGNNGTGTWRATLYGASGYYGFLDGAWNQWDIRKQVNGPLLIDQGSGLETVLTTATAIVDGSGTAGKITKWSDSDTVTDSSFLSESGTTLTNTATTFKIASASGDGVLQVYGAGGSDDGRVELLNQSGSTAEGFRIRYDNDVGDTYFDNMWANGSDANPAIRFRTKTAGTAVNAMTISHGGNVGMGVNPGSYKLNVAGSFKATSGSSSVAINEYQNGAVIWLDGADGDFSGGDYFNIKANNSNQMTFGYAGGDSVYLSSDGKLGIGVAPARSLDLSTTGQMTFGDVVSGTNTSHPGIYWHSSQSYGIYRTSGSWSSPNYQQLQIKFDTGIIINPGSGSYGKSFLAVVGGLSVGDSYYTTMEDNGLIVQGSVGIGTNDPSYLLDLESTATGLTHNLKLNKSSNTGDYAEIAFQLWSGAGTGLNTFGGSGTSRPSVVLRAVNESTSSAAGAFVVGTFTGGSTNSTLTEKFRINSVGSVGIGTASPVEKLDVVGKQRITQTITSNNTYYMLAFGSNRGINDYGGLNKDYWRLNVVTPGASTTGEGSGHGYGDLRFSSVTGVNTTYADRLTIRYNGNIGIGTNVPSAKLAIVNSSTDATPTALLQNSSTGDASLHFNISGRSYTIGIDNSDGDKFKISRNNGLGTTDRLTINGDGNVGIGTTDPGQKLDVVGIIRSHSTNPQVRIQTSSGTGAGYLVFGDSSDDDRGQIYYSHSNDSMVFIANATNMLTLTSGALYPSSNGTKDLGLSGSRWNNVYSEAGNFSGTVTAAAFSGTADKSNMVTGSAFATTGSPGSVLEYQQAASITDTKLAPTTDWYNTIRMGHGNPYSYYSNTIAMQMTGTGAGQIKTQRIANNVAQGWRTVWDSGNDGSGSGLDADLLDGQHGSHYLAAANLTGTVPVAIMNKVLPTSGNYTWNASTTAGNYTTGLQLAFVRSNEGWPNYGSVLHVGARGGTDAGGDFQIYCGHGSAHGGNYLRVRNADNSATPTDSWTDWRTIWDSGNDGSGSGLDADKLDGLEYNHFAYRASGGTGYYIVSSWLQFSGTYGPYWNAGVGQGWHIYPASTDSMRWRAAGAGVRSNLRLDVGANNYGNLCASTTMGYGLRKANVNLSTDSDWDLLINTDGNVGIGTTDPSALLEVGNDGSTDYALIGPTKIGGGFGHGDYAGFSHRDRSTTTSYALLQHTGGTTYLNSNIRIYMGVNNANYTAQVESDRFQVNNTLKLNDNSKIKIGSSDDLEIYHNSADSFISDVGTGNLVISGSGVWIKNAAINANMIGCVEGSGGYVKLYQNGNEKLATSSVGVSITGRLNTSGRVGINGTTIPTYSLNVYANTANSATGSMHINAALNGSGKGLVINSQTRTTSENSVAALEIINRAGGNTLTATVAGNVGIGTTQPSQKLDVNGNTELNGSVNIVGGGWLSFDGEQGLRKSGSWLYLADGGFTSGLYTRIKIRTDGYDISPYRDTASVTSATTLGLSTKRWYNVYSQAGNFSGFVIAGGIALGAGNLTTTGNISGNGSGLTALNASNIGSGTVPAARLGSGATSSKFLRGDNTWQTVSSGSNPNNATITLSAGTNLSGGGNFTTNQSSNETITFNMATGGFGAGTYGSTSDSSKIDQITLDAYGRVTNITTGGTGAGDITAVNVGGALSGGGSSGSVTVSLGNAGAGAGTYGDTSNSVKIDQITLDQYGRVTNVTTGATGSGSMSGWYWGVDSSTATYISNGETVRIKGGTNVTVSRSGNDVTINASGGGSTPNNKTITLSAGTGLSNGGAFTTNQSFNETITFNVDGTVCRGVSAPSGSATPSSGSFNFYQSGGITVAASGSSVTFSSSSASDYRLKKNVTDFNSESWTKVKSVSCRKFDFDAEKFAQAMEDDYTIPRPASYGGRIGFIAHELEALGIDGAVEGEKDGVDENGVPIYQKVSYTTLVPVLWGALNEAIRKIEILESKVQALEDSS